MFLSLKCAELTTPAVCFFQMRQPLLLRTTTAPIVCVRISAHPLRSESTRSQLLHKRFLLIKPLKTIEGWTTVKLNCSRHIGVRLAESYGKDTSMKQAMLVLVNQTPESNWRVDDSWAQLLTTHRHHRLPKSYGKDTRYEASHVSCNSCAFANNRFSVPTILSVLFHTACEDVIVLSVSKTSDSINTCRWR